MGRERSTLVVPDPSVDVLRSIRYADPLFPTYDLAVYLTCCLKTVRIRP